MIAELSKTFRVTTTKYEYVVVEVKVGVDTAVDGVPTEGLSDYLNNKADEIAKPELTRLYDVTDATQGSFIIPYTEGEEYAS